MPPRKAKQNLEQPVAAVATVPATDVAKEKKQKVKEKPPTFAPTMQQQSRIGAAPIKKRKGKEQQLSTPVPTFVP
jgi:hypothetical protein